jgi:hypothetical protein
MTVVVRCPQRSSSTDAPVKGEGTSQSWKEQEEHEGVESQGVLRERCKLSLCFSKKENRDERAVLLERRWCKLKRQE